ncbi:3254_t:CDS:2 [Funneliformis caledonium]|uniref:3254_t:CDS:1 n=1 Tax=Funneliformis caledonium TaxID=1117310 RepID=A0A9N9F971_9GLOM|nr:3254_t:CDS:2 [Funneliformis caledonium]
MSLFFVPLTSPLLDPIPINISETITINDQEKPKDNLTIGDLKIIIWGIIGDNSNSKDFFKLKLWKVDLEEGKGKWKELETLAKSSYTEAEIENFGGIKLLTTSKVVEVFESKEGRDSLLAIHERLNKIIDFVEGNRVSLLRSPPSSGKSTLGQTLRDHFQANCFSIYISLAGLSNKACKDEELFDKFWEKEVGYTWTNIIEKEPAYIFIDEIQIIYGECAQHFWGSIKTMMSSECTKNIHILLIGTFDPTLGVALTPVKFGDSHSLSLKDLLLTRNELKNLVMNYSQIRAISGSPKFKIPEVIENAIFRLTNGHAGLCRIILDSLHNHFKNGPLALEMLRHLASTNLKNYLYSESRALCWIANWDMSANDSELIRDMIYTTRNGITSNFEFENPIIKNFLKIGLLVKDVNSTQPKFTAPILLIILSHHMIDSNLKSLQRDPTSQDFNEFLIRSIERMSQHILLESYGRGVNSRLYEAGWQNEWYRSAVSVVPIGTSISANVGYVFGSDGYLDYYVNGEICWGIELTREGNRLAEHANRFYENGKYKNIPLKEWIILDFRHNSKTINELKQNFWYILYSDDYSSVTIKRYGYEDKICYLQK